MATPDVEEYMRDLQELERRAKAWKGSPEEKAYHRQPPSWEWSKDIWVPAIQLLRDCEHIGKDRTWNKGLFWMELSLSLYRGVVLGIGGWYVVIGWPSVLNEYGRFDIRTSTIHVTTAGFGHIDRRFKNRFWGLILELGPRWAVAHRIPGERWLVDG